MITVVTDAGNFSIPETAEELTITQVFEFYSEDEKFIQEDNIGFLTTALTSCYGDVSMLPMGDIDDYFVIGEELTAFGLYRYTIDIINEYVPKRRKEFIIEHHSELYTITHRDAEGIRHSVGYTVGEVVTIKTFIDYASKRRSRGMENVDYNLTLEQIAVILRKEDEQLPVHVADRTRFIDERKRLFADLRFSDAMDIIFFLMST